ncbi:GYD domain-containing protein [Polyangium aurulentum]|uniref:GYD domain-containing protein n=1 Tax=Polyangium aurulentum TaxID=2567896 RepID=UPI0010AE543D|nr:GYD domain-containing protein [Polyangium aurulentum]UQA62574.1 GYD domain-containing protein [Polyangium aurulentum]
MATFVMLTRLSQDSIRSQQAFEELGQEVIGRLESECPEVRWVGNYMVLGQYDYLDIFEAPSNEVAAKVASIVRSYSHATTEIWPATQWDRFNAMMNEVEAHHVHPKAA